MNGAGQIAVPHLPSPGTRQKRDGTLSKEPSLYYKSSLCNLKSMLRKARDSASLAIQGTFPRLVSGGYAAPIPPLNDSISDLLAYAAGTFF